MSCLRFLTHLVVITGVACWTEPFNWHFLPKHYRLYSNRTADHTVQFDTDCGTLAADSGASHFLWDPESGLCSISSALTAVDFSVSNQQVSKTSFYYARDFALVVPPGSANCPTDAQLKQMIDNLLSLNGSFRVEPDPSRRTWRDACKKNEYADAKPATSTASTASPTSTATTTANMPSVIKPVTGTDRTSSSTVVNGLTKTDSSSTSPATSAQSSKPSGRTPAVPPAAAATAPLPMMDTLGTVPSAIVAHTPFVSNTDGKATSFVATDTTMEEDRVTPTSITPSVMTAPDSPTAAATTDSHSTVSNTMTRSHFTSVTSANNASLVTRDTSMAEHSVTTASTATTTRSAGSAASDPNVDGTMPTPSNSRMHSESTSLSSSAFTRNVTTARETTMKSDSSVVKTSLASSTTSVRAQESTTTSTQTVGTITTVSALPRSSAAAETTGGVKTTVPNGKTTNVASTALNALKLPSTTKQTTTDRPTTAKQTTIKRTTTRPTSSKLTTTKPTTKTTCEEPSTAVFLYQAYRADVYDYFYTTSPRELANSTKIGGYTDDGIAGRILRDKAPNSIPLYRMYHAGNHAHFYTVFEQGRLDAIGHGYTFEGTAGYVYMASKAAPYCPCTEVRPLHRLIKNSTTAHYFYTMDAAEIDRAVGERWYKADEVAACIYPL